MNQAKHNKRKFYLEPQELYDAIKEAQEQGQPTVKMCSMFRQIAQNMLHGARFHGYSKELKEDMESAAMEKCIRSYPNVKPEQADSCFAYITLACQCAFYGVLKKHYRHQNLMRELREDYIAAYSEIDPIGAKRIMDYSWRYE